MGYKSGNLWKSPCGVNWVKWEKVEESGTRWKIGLRRWLKSGFLTAACAKF